MNEKCVSCGRQATRICPHAGFAGALLCAMPICELCTDVVTTGISGHIHAPSVRKMQHLLDEIDILKSDIKRLENHLTRLLRPEPKPGEPYPSSDS
jgi:hypothetical protein